MKIEKTPAHSQWVLDKMEKRIFVSTPVKIKMEWKASGDVVLLKRDSELNQCPIAIIEYVMSYSNGIFRSVKLWIENSDHPFFLNQGWWKSDFQKTGKKMVFLLVKEMLVDFAKKEHDSRQL